MNPQYPLKSLPQYGRLVRAQCCERKKIPFTVRDDTGFVCKFVRKSYGYIFLRLFFAFVGGILAACFLGLVPTEMSRKAFAPVLKVHNYICCFSLHKDGLQEFYNINLFAPNTPGYLGITYWVSKE